MLLLLWLLLHMALLCLALALLLQVLLRLLPFRCLPLPFAPWQPAGGVLGGDCPALASACGQGLAIQ